MALGFSAYAAELTTSTVDASAIAKDSGKKSPFLMELHSVSDYAYKKNAPEQNISNTYFASFGLKASDKETFYISPTLIHNLNQKYINAHNTEKIADKQVELRFVRTKWLEQAQAGIDLKTDVRHTINLPHRDRKEVKANETQFRLAALHTLNDSFDLESQYRYYTTYGSGDYNDMHRLYLTSYYHFAPSMMAGLSLYEQRSSATDKSGISNFNNTFNSMAQVEYDNGTFGININASFLALTKKAIGKQAIYEMELVYYIF
jgi:hypothetical protein